MKNKLYFTPVSMDYFLANYVYQYIDDNNISQSPDEYDELREKIKNINHYDADEIIDILKDLRVGFKDITQEQINRGEVICVKSKGFKGRGMQVIAYRRPSIVFGDEVANEASKDGDKLKNLNNVRLPDSYAIRESKRNNGNKKYRGKKR